MKYEECCVRKVVLKGGWSCHEGDLSSGVQRNIHRG